MKSVSALDILSEKQMEFMWQDKSNQALKFIHLIQDFLQTLLKNALISKSNINSKRMGK